MKRNKNPTVLNPTYNKEEEPMVLSISVMNLLLKEPNASDLIALYCFYYYTAKWQKTNQPKATSLYVQKGLSIGYDRFHKAKNKLEELKLIEKIRQTDEKGKVIGWFIKVNFIWSNNTLTKTQISVLPDLGNPCINALNVNNKNKNIKKEITERNKTFLPQTRYLYRTVQKTKNINKTGKELNKWCNDFRILHEKNKISIERIKAANQWYRVYAGGEYIPVIESGYSFRMKFSKIENAMKREQSKFIPKKQKVLDPVEILLSHFSNKSKSFFSNFIQTYFEPAEDLMPQCDSGQLAQVMVEWIKAMKTNRKDSTRDVLTDLQLLDRYIGWLEDQGWINNKTPNLFDWQGKVFQKFIQETSLDKGIDLLSGKFIK